MGRPGRPVTDPADERNRRYESIERRLDAVERAVIDGESTADGDEIAGRADAAGSNDFHDRLATLESRVEVLDDRVAELEAATQALRGYVGGVRAVNRDVERRADAALAAVEALREGESGPGTGDRAPIDPDADPAAADPDGIDSESPFERGYPPDVGDDGPDGASDSDSDRGALAERLRDVL